MLQDRLMFANLQHKLLRPVESIHPYGLHADQLLIKTGPTEDQAHNRRVKDARVLGCHQKSVANVIAAAWQQQQQQQQVPMHFFIGPCMM